MSIEPSLWLLGLTLAIVGPILIRGHVRRVREETRRRTESFLAKAQADAAPQNSVAEKAP